MKKILLIYIIGLLFYSNKALSQSISDPITGSTDPNNVGEIISDFGPRFVKSKYDNAISDASYYHSGLDYKLGLYEAALAVETGDVTRIRSLGEDDAYIEVGNWWYMHIQDELTPAFDWEIISDGNNNLYNDIVIIRMTYFNGEIVPIAAYVSVNSPLYSNGYIFPDPLTGTPVTLSTNVPQGNIVFRARNYSNGPHLHLQRNSDYWDNPLNYVPYKNNADPAFGLQVKFKQQVNESFIECSPIYGSDVFIENRIDMQSDKDFDHLKIEYSADVPGFQTLYEWYVSGANNHLKVNRKTGQSTESPANPRHVIHRYAQSSLHSDAEIQKRAEEGIFPLYVYPCSIDYYKMKWNTQEKEENSENILNYKYKDGNYNIRSTATDLGGAFVDVNSVITLDNLKPYIEKVIVKKTNESGPDVYMGQWKWNGSALEFSKITGVTLTGQDAVSIKVVTSEPMQQLQLTVFGITKTKTTAIAGTNNKEWLFSYAANEVTLGDNQLVFSSANSKDLAGNNLWGFNSKENISEASIPKHQNSGLWIPEINYIDDNVHLFSTYSCESVAVAFRAEQTSQINEIKFTNEFVAINNINWLWDFGDGTTSTDKSPVHIYNKSGSFNVTLTAEECAKTLTKQKYINIVPPYINKVQIKKVSDGALTFGADRKFISGAFSFTAVNYRLAFEEDDLEVKVNTSLPLKNLKMEIYNQNDILVYNTESFQQGSNNTKEWNFILTADKLPKGLYNIGFSGKDYIDEELIKIKEPGFAPVYIDQTGAGWSINQYDLQGVDDNYVFTVRGETTGNIDDYLYFSIKKDGCLNQDVTMFNFHDNFHTVFVDGVDMGACCRGDFVTFTLDDADHPYKITVFEQKMIDGVFHQVLVLSKIIDFSN